VSYSASTANGLGFLPPQRFMQEYMRKRERELGDLRRSIPDMAASWQNL
jgi:hypothetical protein